MKSSQNTLWKTLRYLGIGVFVATAGTYYVTKFRGPISGLSNDEAASVCRSVSGCKELSFAQRFDKASKSWKLEILIAIPSGQSRIQPKVVQDTINAIQQARVGKGLWNTWGWDGYHVEVRYVR